MAAESGGCGGGSIREGRRKMRTVIEKDHISPGRCHHLCVILDDRVIAQTIDGEGHTVNLPRMRINSPETAGIIAKIAVQYRRKVYLSLELSFEKKKDKYICRQCGQALSVDEYRMYRDIFKKARGQSCDAGKIKEIFEYRRSAKGNKYVQLIAKGTQKYEKEISRIIAAGILAHEDRDKRYEAAMEELKL